MEEKNTTKKREWVKNVAIIFLSVMLVLTFFSNTIMNYSLPEVATQQVMRGTITAKIRGTGTVEATDPYNVIAKESRVISSVAVKQGDVVEKDQVIYYLEDAESEELTKAQQELEDLELAYMKGLFGANVSSEIISKVANGNVDSFSQLQAKVTDMQNRVDAAQKRVEECQQQVDHLTLQSTKSTNDATVSTKNEELSKDQASTDLTNAKERFEKDKASKIAQINTKITELTAQIADLEKLIAGGTLEIGTGTASGTLATLQTKLSDAKIAVDAAFTALQGITPSMPPEVNDIEKAFGWCQNIDWTQYDAEEQKTIQKFMAAYADYQSAKDAVSNVSEIEANQIALANKQAELSTYQAELTEVQAITATTDEEVKNAQSRLDQASRNILEITTANSQSSVAWQNQLADANAALKNAQAVLELLKTEQTELTSNINAELDLAKASKDIAKKEEEIAGLKEKSMGAAIKAPVAGTVTTLNYVAGETTKPEEVTAVIQVEGKGFTLSVSVTNEQAKKVRVGDVAELQNAWYYDDVMVTLAAIRPDPDKANTNKLLIFDVTGSTIQSGQSLSISVGQKSAEYELVVPNSAVREDNNGKFILTVESKSSPLGNRYIATRTNVEVLASDDNNSAISAPLYGYEYVITTSTKPVEEGKQVRFHE